MLSLMLTRYGVSVLAVEKVTSMIIPGQADGLQPRTLEVLRTLGLAEEILSQGFPNYRMAFWNPGAPGEPRIVRTAVTDDVTVPSRYPHKVLLAAGRVVNILERQMNKYGNEVERGLEFTRFELVGGDFPVRVYLRDVVSGRAFSVLTKHLVGADGYVIYACRSRTSAPADRERAAHTPRSESRWASRLRARAPITFGAWSMPFSRLIFPIFENAAPL